MSRSRRRSRGQRSQRAQARPSDKGRPGLRSSYFVTCAPGLEPVLHEEMRALKFSKVERQVGGVYFEGDAVDAMRANLELRCAVRVLKRVTRFQAQTSDELYAGVQSIDWSEFRKLGSSLVVAAQTRDSELDHSLFIEQRVKDAVCDRELEARGERPEVDKESPDMRINVHLFRDRCTLSVDTSGDSLHKRGWRRFQGGAPLAENLAAGLVFLSGWDLASPLVDPFCGSGTLLIEAALLAADRAPGLFRDEFGFRQFPDHDEALWQSLRDKARERARPLGKAPWIGFDADEEVLEGAQRNLESAGLAERIELRPGRAEEFAPKPGWNACLLTNPPYGERLGDVQQLVQVYREFGANLREAAAGYRLALFSGNRELDAAMGIEFDRRIALANGALACELCLANL